MKSFLRKKEQGFTIIEVIITIAILTFGIVLVYSAFNVSTVLSYSISSRFTAAYLAQEGLELIRNIRDYNFTYDITPWYAGLTDAPCDEGCQADYTIQDSSQLKSYGSGDFLWLNSDGFYGYDDDGAPTIFKRKITTTLVEETNEDVLKVEAMVEWTYNNKSYTYEASEYLYHWK